MDAKLVSIAVERLDIDTDHATAGAEIRDALDAISGVKGYTPVLAPETVTLVLKNVPTAVPNALRRVVKDEMPGRCLTFALEDFVRHPSTDLIMGDIGFVHTRLQLVPLRPQISKELIGSLRYELNATNPTDTVMTVYAGDLVAVAAAGDLAKVPPLFDPMAELAFLQPGKSIYIQNIRIAEGVGTQDAAFAVGIRAATKPLDIPEAPRAETHEVGGARSEESGFLVSSLVANPRTHQLRVTFPAIVAGSRTAYAILADACELIINRVRFAQKVVEISASLEDPASFRATGASFVVVADGSRQKGILTVRDETDTIGNLLARYTHELVPDIGYVGYTCVPHEKTLRLTVAHAVSDPSEIASLLTEAAQHAIKVFAELQKSIKAAI